jgi:hypothetical protein
MDNSSKHSELKEQYAEYRNALRRGDLYGPFSQYMEGIRALNQGDEQFNKKDS